MIGSKEIINDFIIIEIVKKIGSNNVRNRHAQWAGSAVAALTHRQSVSKISHHLPISGTNNTTPHLTDKAFSNP